MIKKILVVVAAIIVVVIGVAVWAFSGRDPLQQYLSQRAEKTSLTFKSVFTDADRFVVVCPGAEQADITMALGQNVTGKVAAPKDGNNTLVSVAQGKAEPHEYQQQRIDLCENLPGGAKVLIIEGEQTYNFVQPANSSQWVMQH